MAYNPADGKIYGVADGSLVTVDRFTAEVQAVGQIPVTTNTLACSEDGTFYCNEYGTGKIWQFTLDSLKTEPPVKYDFDGDGTVSTGDVQALLVTPPESAPPFLTGSTLILTETEKLPPGTPICLRPGWMQET